MASNIESFLQRMQGAMQNRTATAIGAASQRSREQDQQIRAIARETLAHNPAADQNQSIRDLSRLIQETKESSENLNNTLKNQERTLSQLNREKKELVSALHAYQLQLSQPTLPPHERHALEQLSSRFSELACEWIQKK